jgi:hypothetical protein
MQLKQQGFTDVKNPQSKRKAEGEPEADVACIFRKPELR